MQRRFLPALFLLLSAAPALFPCAEIMPARNPLFRPGLRRDFAGRNIPHSVLRIPHSSFRIQKDFALFFATDTYAASASWRKLYAPVKDAREIAADLYDLYGFDTAVVVNPTKDQLRAKLAEYARREYPGDGQLLVFFSGHGAYIDLLKDGFYIPRDGKPSREDPYGDSWLKYTDLRRTISGIPCPHILLAVDACYSGTLDEGIVFGRMDETDDLDRPGEAETQRAQRIQDLLRPRTRLFITSGVKDYVPDPSEFAAQFKAGLRGLGGKSGLLDVHGLYYSFLKNVPSQPVLRSFEQDQASSTFLFDYHNRRAPSRPPAPDPADALARDRQAWAAAKAQNTGAAYREYQRQFPQGEFSTLAAEAIARLDEDAAWVAAKAQNTGATYRDFIARFPDSAYKVLAEARLKGLNPPPAQQPFRAPDMPEFMVRITGGTFQMGDAIGDGIDDKETVHTVRVSDFYLGKTEVTFDEYDAYWTATRKEKPRDADWGRGKRPVINISWLDAVEYCNWLSEQQHLEKVYTVNGSLVTANWNANGYRLPTEAEWEYAARQGGQNVRFGNGKDVADPAEINFNGDKTYKSYYSRTGKQRGKTVQVASFPCNSLGLYDMSGNVWEWCWDWYDLDYYVKSISTNPHGPDSGSFRVLRGGSWFNGPARARASCRDIDAPWRNSNNIGFRLARAAGG